MSVFCRFVGLHKFVILLFLENVKNIKLKQGVMPA